MEHARTASFWLIALWLLLSPGLVQLGRTKPGLIRPWQMYSGSGKGICDVQFYNHTPEGDLLVPRLATLRPGKHLYEIPNSERRVELPEVTRIGQQICAVIRAEDLRADVRCAGSKGWRTEMSREKNLCKQKARR